MSLNVYACKRVPPDDPMAEKAFDVRHESLIGDIFDQKHGFVIVSEVQIGKDCMPKSWHDAWEAGTMAVGNEMCLVRKGEEDRKLFGPVAEDQASEDPGRFNLPDGLDYDFIWIDW